MRPGRSSNAAPGAAQTGRDRFGTFPDLLAELLRSREAGVGGGILAVADRRVLELHPQVARALRSAGIGLVPLPGGERTKTLDTMGRILRAGLDLPRDTVLLAIGGGSIGDVATVAAHLLKRGVDLIHVPTTLLAAVDSSVGGKGAVHLAGGNHSVKNAAGVFHYPVESWICLELLASLSPRQVFEGEIEAYKMAACLDAVAWSRYRKRKPPLARLIREARALKKAVCAEDPYERSDRRRLLNFGHTFGHVFESLTDFELSHGEAVCLGILCALDIGRAMRVTSEETAEQVERVFTALWHGVNPRIAPRKALARTLSRPRLSALTRLLAADKKVDARGRLRMTLIAAIGRAEVRPVDVQLWQAILREQWRNHWRAGDAP